MVWETHKVALTRVSQYAENEPVCKKTNNLGSDKVRHQPGCKVTEDG